jgi:hypothetical protein
MGGRPGSFGRPTQKSNATSQLLIAVADALLAFGESKPPQYSKRKAKVSTPPAPAPGKHKHNATQVVVHLDVAGRAEWLKKGRNNTTVPSIFLYLYYY